MKSSSWTKQVTSNECSKAASECGRSLVVLFVCISCYKHLLSIVGARVIEFFYAQLEKERTPGWHLLVSLLFVPFSFHSCLTSARKQSLCCQFCCFGCFEPTIEQLKFAPKQSLQVFSLEFPVSTNKLPLASARFECLWQVWVTVCVQISLQLKLVCFKLWKMNPTNLDSTK